MGLASAWFLREAGTPVTVVDPGDPTLRAAWAAGGMLAPLAEAPDPGPFLALALESLARFPEFVARVEARGGRPVGLRLNGKLLTATDAEGVAGLRRRHAWQARDGHAVEWLEGNEVRELEPALSPRVRGGLLLHGNGRVDNRALMEALVRVVLDSGVRFVQGRVEGVAVRGGRAAGVKLQGGGSLSSAGIVVAAGAWSGMIRGLPHPLPVRPVRGQMLSLATPDRPLERVVAGPDIYLIPRETREGPLVVLGATEEEGGFDLHPRDPGQEKLHHAALRLVPSLEGAPVTERWAGLRPGTPDDLPILGPDPLVEGLFYATGHFRNGILLAPVTAARVREWWEGDGGGAEEAFSPTRFSGG